MNEDPANSQESKRFRGGCPLNVEVAGATTLEAAGESGNARETRKVCVGGGGGEDAEKAFEAIELRAQLHRLLIPRIIRLGKPNGAFPLAKVALVPVPACLHERKGLDGV